MATFLTRRIIQMFVVLIASALVSFGLLYIAPGGPLSGLRQSQNSGRNKISNEDILRIKERFELDLYLPYRFSRWLIGFPSGPITIAGQSFFGNTMAGCAIPGQARLRYPDGHTEMIEDGCQKAVTFADLTGRRSSRGILFGDFGLSQVILRDRPIASLIASRLPYTLQLMGISSLIALLIGVPLGVYSAVRQYSRFDYTMTTISFVGSSIPTFVIGIICILIFAIAAKEAGLLYLPPGNAVANSDYVVPFIGNVVAESSLDRFLHFVMPCTVLVFVNIAGYSRFIRSGMLEVLRLDYVRTARAKGLQERTVVLKHALRNAMLPFITIMAGVLAELFGGAAITESIFNWPGLGRLLVDSIGRNDYSVAMALTMVSIFLLLIGYLITDILYSILDPRIRLS
ncbi:MAG: ABC transporter permease [Chloroflexia bacterium]|nr:ABC transporter permease [Chloroflexia bacterium]